MKIYTNPNCKKIRGSHILEVSCAHCKCFIAKYQKVGESNFVKMYNDRIIEGSIDFSQYHGAIFCPNCNERIATRYMTKMDNKEAYRFVPSGFNKKKVRSQPLAPSSLFGGGTFLQAFFVSLKLALSSPA